MKKIFKKISSNGKIIGFLSLTVVAMSTYGANTKCYAIFHEVEKPKALDLLKKY